MSYSNLANCSLMISFIIRVVSVERPSRSRVSVIESEVSCPTSDSLIRAYLSWRAGGGGSMEVHGFCLGCFGCLQASGSFKRRPAASA